MLSNQLPQAKKQRGMTLIEILVTMVILSIGLLGLASLMLEGLQSNQSAYLRTQASIYAYDMADRIRINTSQSATPAAASAVASAYNNFSTDSMPALPGCSTTGCTQNQLAQLDMAEWAQQINGSGSGEIAMLPGGVGTIELASTPTGNIFTIKVTWQEDQWNDATEQNVAGGAQQFSLVFGI